MYRKYIGTNLFFSIFLLPPGEEDNEEEPIMILKNYVDSGIVSTKKPFNTNLWWEHTTYGITMVDSTNQTVLLQSTIARLLVDPSDWTTIDLSDNTNSYKIQAGWLEGNDLWLVMCDNPGNDFEVCFIEFDDTNDCNPVGVSAGADAGSVYAVDIFKLGANMYVCNYEERGGGGAGENIVIWDVDVAPFVEGDVNITGINNYISGAYGVIIGNYYYVVLGIDDDVDGTQTNLYQWDPITPNLWQHEEYIGYRVNTTNPNLKGMSYDGSNIIQFVLEKVADGKNYLHEYNITTAIISLKSEHNVALMSDRNTASGVMEKAFHITEDSIYQLHSANKLQLHQIAEPATDAVWVGITDNLVINNDGDIWEYEDITPYVSECVINMRKMGAWTASLSIFDTIPMEKGMFITIEDMFTTAGASASQIIFEGYVGAFTKRGIQAVELISPAQRDLDEEFPTGDYSGRSDQIIVSLIGDYADYITPGTLSAGMAMGTITFGGDKSLREIFDEFALQDNFIWDLTPIGALNYNDGTVDSVENFTATSPISNVNKTFGQRALNYVNIKGGFVSGVQVSGTVAENIPDQQTNGRLPYEATFSHLDLAAQCTTTNTNILTRLGTQPLIVPFTHVDPTVGVIQPGETVTFEYNLTDPNISSDQFLILDCIYNAKQGKAHYRISDHVI